MVVVGDKMKIYVLRKKAGITQKELAKKLNVSQQAVVKWEKGSSFPSADKLPELARALNCNIEELYEG